MAKNKPMPDVRLSGQPLKEALAQGSETLPSMKPVGQTRVQAAPKPVARANKSLSLPVYVWEALKKHAYETGDSQNVIVMKGLRALGIHIEESDLVDGRSRK